MTPTVRLSGSFAAKPSRHDIPLTPDQQAFVEQHQGLTKSVVTRSRGLLEHVGVDLDDAVAVAEDALMRASRTFDPSRGIKPSTYVWTAISRTLWTWLRRDGARRVRCQAVGDCHDALVPDGTPELELTDETAALLELLPLADADLVRLRFGLDGHGKQRTYDELAARLKVSRQAVAARLAAALDAMRRGMVLFPGKQHVLCYGPYFPPDVRPGDWVQCHLRGLVVVQGRSNGPIRWPLCRSVRNHQRHGLLVDDTLKQALLWESNAAMEHWFGIPRATASHWRTTLDERRKQQVS